MPRTDTLKHEVEQIFKRGKPVYFSEIADELNEDLEDIVRVCEELMKEGKIYCQKIR